MQEKDDERRPPFLMLYTAIADDLSISNAAKVLFAHLTGLANSLGYSWASNEYLAKKMGCSKETVKRLLKQLAGARYIKRRVIRNDKNEIVERRITIAASPFPLGPEQDEDDADDPPSVKNDTSGGGGGSNSDVPMVENGTLGRVENVARELDNNELEKKNKPPSFSEKSENVENSVETVEKSQDAFDYGITPYQQQYAKDIYAAWRKAGLPCADDYWTFLVRDFRLALAPLHRQRLNSRDVMTAIRNYKAVRALYAAGNSNFSKEFRFYDFCEPKNITQFLDGFKLALFEKSEAQKQIEREKAEKAKAQAIKAQKELEKSMTKAERTAKRKADVMANPPYIIPDGMDTEEAYARYDGGRVTYLREDEYEKFKDAYPDDVIIITGQKGVLA